MPLAFQAMTSASPLLSAASIAGTASISVLPNELLVHIFESVPSDYRQQCTNFAAIARVNHAFNSIITPLLYRAFKDCCARHLKLFGRTVLSNEGLAELVKHYAGRHHTRDFSSFNCPTVWSDFALDGDMEEALLRRLPGLSMPITTTIFSDAMTCILPNLQRFHVTNGGNMLVKQLSDLQVYAASPFQQLESLHISTEPDRTYGMHELALLFLLPTLTSLTIDMAVLSTVEEEASTPLKSLWQCSPRSSAIRELTLERCGLPATWVSVMIASCKALKHFHDEHYYWSNSVDYYLHIFEPLTAHEDTLTYLRVNELNGCKVDAVRQTDPPKPLSLQHFRSLTHLDIPLFSFATRSHRCTADHLLPASLEVLTIDVRSAREGHSDDFFISLAEAARSHLPRLKSVEIICRIEEYRENGYLPLHFCHIRRMLAKAGIKLCYFLEFVQCEFKAGKHTRLLVSRCSNNICSLHGKNSRDHEGFRIGRRGDGRKQLARDRLPWPVVPAGRL